MENSSDNSTTHSKFSRAARHHKSDKKNLESKPSGTPDKPNLRNHINEKPAPSNAWLSLGTNYQVQKNYFYMRELLTQQSLKFLSVFATDHRQ